MVGPGPGLERETRDHWDERVREDLRGTVPVLVPVPWGHG